ncbi:GerAB/ArcD/ProY family transporter [Clostridium sp. Mt-5]|uniref:GerAB/ArcD/ProY family transporter n=1 Tax=Clostridium moutaii TaxID=3240932 RepID=A0ABV4BPY1_9CLOT
MKEKISIYQFFILMTMIPYGTASLFFLAPEAKQDVWIALLLYALPGILLQIVYITLYDKYPKDTLVTYMPKIYGKFIGNILSIIYITFFSYISIRVFRDLLELTASFALRHTSKLIFGLVFMIPIIYAVYTGIENISSLIQFYFIILLTIKLGSFFLILLSSDDMFKLQNLKPVLDNGILNVLKNSWQLITFPYGETIVFTMLYPFVLQKNKIKKAAILSIMVDALLLSFNSIVFICTLGVDFATLSNFPLFETYRLMHIGDFLSRLDILFMILFLVEGFFKLSIFLYTAVLGASQVFNLKQNRFLFIPFIVLILSLLLEKNYPQHINIGLNYVPKYISLPLEIVLPTLTLIIFYTKNSILKK